MKSCHQFLGEAVVPPGCPLDQEPLWGIDRSSSFHACLFYRPASREGKMIRWWKTAPQGSAATERGASVVLHFCGSPGCVDRGGPGNRVRSLLSWKGPSLEIVQNLYRLKSKQKGSVHQEREKDVKTVWCKQSFIPSVTSPPWQARPAQEADLGGWEGGEASVVPLFLRLLSGPQTVVPETAALASPGIWLEIQITRPTHAYCIRNSGGGAQQSVLTSCPEDCGVHRSWKLAVCIR